DIDILADAKRVLHQKENPRQDIANERLGAKADSDSDDAGTGDERSDIDAHCRDNAEQCNDDDADEEKISYQRQEGLDPGALMRRFVVELRCRIDILPWQMAIDRDLDDTPNATGQDQCRHDLKACRDDLRTRENIDRPDAWQDEKAENSDGDARIA